MAFNFNYSLKKNQSTKRQKDIEPTVTIYNNEKRKDVEYANSYLFINKAAVKLLQEFGKTDKVVIGIDTETQKIVVIPSDKEGRKMSLQKSGSAQVSVASLINENKIPTQICIARPHSSYAKGGIIFDYVTTTTR